jgi:predicted ester cyclase
MPPTGEEWTFKAMYVHRIAGGKIVEEWTEGDIGPFRSVLMRRCVNASASSRR